MKTNRPGDAVVDPANAFDAAVWIRARALAQRWGCSVSHAHRIAAKHRIRKCLFGGTGINGSSAQNAMVLFSMQDVLALERNSTV
jgi:hypothetical protein